MTTTDTTEPPTHNEKLRETIKEVVGALATDVQKNLNSLRRQIDELDKLVMINAERVANSLNEHADICGNVQQEIVRLTGVIGAIRNTQTDINSQLNGYPHDPGK